MDQINNNNSLKNDLKELSAFLGNNLDWVQGAGGNTSVKENGVLWVKASGYWLSDAQNNNIFTPLDRQAVLDKINQEIEDLSSAQILEKQYHSLRPSIETTLHALMRHRFVAHVHSVNVISYAVLKNSKKILSEKLDSISWLWVPYVRPGLPLTKMLNKMNVSDFDVIILANHGVVIGGDTKEEVLDVFKQVEIRLCRSVRGNFLETDKAKLESLVDSLSYKLPKYDLSHTLANDSLSLKIIAKNALYPDHVIFLGPGTIPVMTQEEFKDRSPEVPSNSYYKVVVIKGIGVIVNQNLSENAEEMLHCLTNVLLRLNPSDELQHLTQNQEAELLGWDAEKYRKSIQR
jgi:rhamnose utilization protein RhaD (predicted bifunctional aldolase and dehydrogenase)